jgi:hypothetical protein
MSKEYWTIWYPQAASTGLLVGRGLLDATERLLVHAAPPLLTAEVSGEDGRRLALGRDLKRTEESPICLLRREGERIVREDLWPGEAHYRLPVLLPGGEVGILISWWNADDRSAWRWQVEFFNQVEQAS